MIANHNKIEWGSHVPVNRALLETYDVFGVIEFGMGYHSTPLFYNSAKKLLCVETDKNWIEEIRPDIQPREGFQILHHDISPSAVNTRRKTLTEEELNRQYDFYKSLDITGYNYLFIDSSSCTRYAVFETLADKFDIVVLHDVNSRGLNNHWNNGNGLELEGYNRYIHSTYQQHTGILLKSHLSDRFDQFEKRLVETTKEWGNGVSKLSVW